MKKFSSITRVNSRHTSRAEHLKRIALIGVIGLVLLFIVPKLLAAVASLVISPVYSFENWLAVSSDSFPRYFRDRSELIDEINALRGAQSAQSGDKLTVALLTQENTQLRNLLGNSASSTRILAGVIGRPNKLPYDVLVLDKGKDDGIVDGAPVFIGGDAIIGIVAKTFAKSAIVELVTTPGFSASVYILGPDIYTDAQGQGGGQLRVSVPQGIALKEGDLVILPGADPGIYGAINAVETTPTQPEQYGYVSPNVPLAGLRLVSVGDRPLEPITFSEAEAIVHDAKINALKVPVPEQMLITSHATTGTSSASSSAKTATTTTL